jgi:hypothetical protein
MAVAALLIAGLTAGAEGVSGADFQDVFSGALLGRVSDSGGVPQMGAAVLLYDRYQHLIRKTITGLDGRFGFPALAPDVYSVRISVPRLFPATRNRVEVKPGLSSVLEIHLASLFSSIDVSYAIPSASMSDDWKWALRSSIATRPVTRLLPGSSSTKNPQTGVFSSTQGVISLSGGDGELSDMGGVQDFGTAFAISTNLYGQHELRLSGAVGQTLRNGMPIAGLNATFLPRAVANGFYGPEVTLSVFQINLPNPNAFNVATGDDSGAALRSMGLSVYDQSDPFTGLHLEYGSAVEAIDFYSHVTRISPFARATYSLGNPGNLVVSLSSGRKPLDLYQHQGGAEEDLATLANAFTAFPQLAFNDHSLRLQSTQSAEAGFVHSSGSRTFGVSGFYENVFDGRLTVAGAVDSLAPGSVLADPGSQTSIFDIGNYNRHGFVVSGAQKLGQKIDFTLVYGRMGGFTVNSGPLDANATPSFLNRADHNVASLNMQAVLPYSATHLAANYGWTDPRVIVPEHLFTTQQLYVTPGLNFIVRQPLPGFLGFGGRLELTAEVRNLLAQGYVPVTTADGRTLLLVQAPRALRGGVSFIF